jgi:hypothetical protein
MMINNTSLNQHSLKKINHTSNLHSNNLVKKISNDQTIIVAENHHMNSSNNKSNFQT